MKHIASCSFGKDSIATILLAIENSEPLDFAIFSEVMFCHKLGISGEIPEHIAWIYGKAIPTLEQLGVSTKVVRAERDYLDCFSRAVGGGKYAGRLYGYPLGGMCCVNRDLKVNPIRKFLRGIGEEVVQYIGIAIDEPKRLSRLKANQISLLAKYGYTEQMALELCRKYDLISPIYETGTRGGCWFCPNVSIPSFVAFRDKHPDLWNELEALSHTPNLCSKGFKYEMPMHEVVKRMNDYKFQQSQPRLFDDENFKDLIEEL